MICKKIIQLMGVSLLFTCASSYAIGTVVLSNASLQTGGLTNNMKVDYYRCDHSTGTVGYLNSQDVYELDVDGGILAVRAKVKIAGHYHHGPWAVFKSKELAKVSAINCNFGVYSGSYYPKMPYCEAQEQGVNIDDKITYADKVTTDYHCNG